MRQSMQVKIGDESHTIKEWAEITGISEFTIKGRYYNLHMRGTALIAPPKILQPVLITVNAETHTFAEWAKITGLPKSTIQHRYYNGKRGIDLITPKKATYITINGKTHTYEEWAVIACLDAKLIANRYYCCGKRGTELIEPLQKYVEIEINGVLHTLKEWSKITGIAYHTLYKRYVAGATAEEFLKPVRKGDENE